MAGLKTMSERERQLFDILKRAIEREREAQAMYLEAMNLCDDPVLGAVLEGFYRDEQRHEREALARYHQFRSDYVTEP
jgi:rubrerythrin